MKYDPSANGTKAAPYYWLNGLERCTVPKFVFVDDVIDLMEYEFVADGQYFDGFLSGGNIRVQSEAPSGRTILRGGKIKIGM